MSGSRVISMRVRRCASVLMTETSRPRRKSLIRSGKTSLSLNRRSVRAASACRQFEQRRRSARRTERFDGRAAGRKRIERNIDPVQIEVVGLAILQMIDDLQRRAQRIVGRPHGSALAVHVADKAADRHGRQRAIADEIVPIAIAELGDVELERGKQILRMLGRKIALGKRVAQPHRYRIFVALSGQARIEAIEQRKLFFRLERGMVGDVVRGAHEIVERQDWRTMARLNQPGSHREIFIPMTLARAPVPGVTFARVTHRNSETLACARPFHMPPRPRAC